MNRTVSIIWVVWGAAIILTVPYLSSRTGCTVDVPGTGSFVMRILGEAGTVISDTALLQADLYYHGGIEHQGLCDHFAHEGAGEGTHDHHHTHKEADTTAVTDHPYNPLFSLSEDLKISEHAHLKGEELKEVLPWLYYAMRTDPGNVTAVSLSAYFLARKFGRPDRALSVLKKGLGHNPGSWRLNADLGRLYLSDIRDYRQAAIYLRRAYSELKEGEFDKFQMRYVLTLLALSYERLGDKSGAKKVYLELYGFFPHSGAISEKLRGLKDGD